MKNPKQSALDYISRIRNSEKKRYAQAYFDYCEGVTDMNPSFSSTFCCHYSAKQAVRFELACFGICPENRSDKGEVKK